MIFYVLRYYISSKELILLVPTGRFPPDLDDKNGRILFNFIGDNCPFGANYTVKVIMYCDYDIENNSYPELFSHVSRFSFRYV